MRNFFEFTGRLEEEQTIQEEFVLTSEDPGQVPETITREGTEYTLDESSIRIQVSKTELWREQQVMDEYVTYAVEDNDIDRLQREIIKDGRVLELIGVEYSITEKTESGLPLAYDAKCRYAVNVDRDREVPVEWKATASYTGTVEEVLQESTEEERVLEAVSENESISSPPVAELETETPEETEEIPEVGSVQEEIIETEVFGDETVPLAAAVEKPVISAGVVTGMFGTAGLGAAIACCIILRKKTQVSVYMSSQGKDGGRFLGKTSARIQKGLLVIPIPEKFLKLPGVNFRDLILKPSGKLLARDCGRAKIVSSAGILYTGIEGTMFLRDSEI